MELRPLGKTGIRVSPIGLGTVKLGRTEGVKYPRPFEIPDDRAAAELLDVAQSLGVNLLDTAPAYGSSEERLGELLRGRRDRWIIATKAGEDFLQGVSHFDFSPGAIRASIEQSLGRLRTDRLDIVLLHSDGHDEEIIERSGALEALEQLREEGKVRAVGVSTKTPEGGVLAAQRCDVVMLTCNPDYTDDVPAIAMAHKHGCAVLVKKALASGHIAPDDADGEPVESSLRFVFSHAGVSSVVIGTISPAHLRANVQAAQRAIAAITSR